MKKRSTTFRQVSWKGILAVAGCLIMTPDSFPQGLYNQSSLFITGATIHVDGEINNMGSVDNDGALVFTGDWQSEGVYQGNGVLQASGNTPQKISHGDQEVHTLVADGGGPKYLKGRIRITHALHLNYGIIGVSPGNTLLLEQSAVIFGGNSGSYVDGAITVAGTGYKFFPVGKNGTYAPIEFLNARGKHPEYSVELFDDAPVISVENAIVRRGLYWQRKDLYGEFHGSAVAVDYDRSYFQNPDRILLLTGTDWSEPFVAITDLDQSQETAKLSTNTDILTPIIMLGESSEHWYEADFYFSTALSPHASFAENRKVKIFGERLGPEQFHFQVFNRWGDLVYESTSLEHMVTNGWDGRSMNGSALASGTYPYRLTGYDRTGRKLERKGVITIIN